MRSVPRGKTAAQLEIAQAIRAEGAVLAGFLLNAPDAPLAFELLSPSDFFDRSYAIIFQTLYDNHKKKLPTDDVGILMDCLGNRLGDDIETGLLIAKLTDGVPKPRREIIEFHCQTVRRAAQRRHRQHAVQRLTELIAEKDFDTADTRYMEDYAQQLRIVAGADAGYEWLTAIFETPDEIQNAQPITFAIQGFLQCESTTLIAGLSGHYKTWVMLSMVKALLTGEPLFGFFPVIHSSIQVVYLIPESPRGPFKGRLETMGLMPFVKSGQLIVRTLSKGPAPSLQDPRILTAAEDADIFLDTAVRFMQGDESSASDNARGLATDIFALLAAGARTITAAQHSPKGFESLNYMSLENMVRGSGDIGAMVATAWGVRQLPGDIVHVENIKPRDFNPCGPFELAARPYLSDKGDFQMYKEPGDCGPLSNEMPDVRNKGGGAPALEREARAGKLALLRGWLAHNPRLTSPQIVELYAKEGIEVVDGTVRRYRAELEKKRS